MSNGALQRPEQRQMGRQAWTRRRWTPVAGVHLYRPSLRLTPTSTWCAQLSVTATRTGKELLLFPRFNSMRHPTLTAPASMRARLPSRRPGQPINAGRTRRRPHFHFPPPPLPPLPARAAKQIKPAVTDDRPATVPFAVRSAYVGASRSVVREGAAAMASSRRQWWWCLLLAAWCCAVAAAQSSPPAADPLQSKCQGDFGKLTDCMDYATGHAGSPSSTCCGDVGDTEKARPQCLCYIIQQVHTGRNQVQSLGLRFDRLIALPAACSLPNANVSLCINLLNLKPGSADYALFANASKITPSTNPASDSTAGSGFKLQAGILGSVTLALISAVVSSVF